MSLASGSPSLGEVEGELRSIDGLGGREGGESLCDGMRIVVVEGSRKQLFDATGSAGALRHVIPTVVIAVELDSRQVRRLRMGYSS